MQLVPGLIAQLKVDNLTTLATGKKGKARSAKEQSVEERRKELAAMLAGSGEATGAEDDQDEQMLAKSKNQIGMEWGSVAVFGCGNDCVGFNEEWVGVEWEEGS